MQRNDIAMAITKYDHFDFLIDIVPGDDIKPTKVMENSSVRMISDEVFQLAQQHHQALQPHLHEVVQTGASAGVQTIFVAANQHQPQIIQLQPQQTQQAAPQAGGIQIVHQIMGPNCEIQQIPFQLSQQQLQMIKAQMLGGTGQPIVIQTAPIQATAVQGHQLAQGQQVYIQQESTK